MESMSAYKIRRWKSGNGPKQITSRSFSSLTVNRPKLCARTNINPPLLKATGKRAEAFMATAEKNVDTETTRAYEASEMEQILSKLSG